MSLRILLADDHVMVRQGLKALLEREKFEIAGEASDGREAVRLAESLRPDLILLDLAMPLLNGMDATREILKSNPSAKVILLTMHSEDSYVLEALRAGAVGYVVKTRASGELLQAIREVQRGHFYLSPGVSRVVISAFLAKNELPMDPLTARERQVLQLIAEGKTTKEAAVVLDISVKTAESHRTRIMHKLNIHETAGLVRYAIRLGLTQP
ncbi:MAG TPA: response regulator transcription factor [Candidatus Polarisedimenticolia bacterium]|nr:response regulator transcription factor [Candidatus Polarisedimenticolia bacterium]